MSTNVLMRAIPWTVLTALVALTGLVWKKQIDHERSMLTRHTEDVCVQAARRLEMFIDSRIDDQEIFATRWAAHGNRDFSRHRFEEFSSVLLGRVAGYRNIWLVHEGGDPIWSAPTPSGTDDPFPERLAGPVIAEARRTGDVVLSPPGTTPAGQRRFLAALQMRRGNEALGCLVVEIGVDSLMAECFHQRIRTEFDFIIQDGEEVFYTHPEGLDSLREESGAAVAVQEFPVRNRRWQISMTTRETLPGTLAVISVPLLGLALSVSVALLVHLLVSRMKLYREARDRAEREIEERKRAEERHAQLAQKMLVVQEEERARLSRDLHDDLGQILSALRLELSLVEKNRDRKDGFTEVSGLVERAAVELRRICRGLHPPLLDDLGMVSAVRHLVEEFGDRIDAWVDLETELDDDVVVPEIALASYRILQEALTNVSRHAGAKTVIVSLARDGEDLLLSVQDDGRGFDAVDVIEDRGFGIAGMRERAALVRGTLDIRSIPSVGTRIRFRAPAAFQDSEGPS